jgi:serine phosphatase RsbU (regulator of sigma subunit)
MEYAARQFARRILMVHLALLAGVAGIVFFASREVYDRTKAEATEQAKARQALLAGQTAKGIEAFYRSIFNDLDLLRQADHDEDEDGVAMTPTTKLAGPRLDWRQLLRMDDQKNPVNAAVQTFVSGLLWKQLETRVVTLFAVDRGRGGRRGPPGWESERGLAVQVIGSNDARLTHREILPRSMDWLRGVQRPQISRYQEYTVEGEAVGINLVCVPVSERNPRLLVAAVPVKRVKTRFTDELNTTGTATNAILCDEAGTIMIGSGGALTGRDVGTLRDERLRDLAGKYIGKGEGGVETIETPYALGGQQFPPGIMAVEPLSIAGKKWTLMVITPLADVDAVVNRVFKRAVFWAVFVVCSMTAILLSTAVQLIRARVRTERVRNDLLTKELTQAREIQLAWLPREGVGSIPRIDIAAVNQPTNHISGDFYNWFELPDGRTVVTIGDVTGHGLSAAFLMATTQLLVHTTMLRLTDPGRTLAEVNKQLCTQVFNGQFVTMLVCVIDMDAGTIEVATAGHYPPIVGVGGTFQSLPVEPQLVLGVEKDVRYPTERFDLPAGASLVLYTDGVIDARGPGGRRFDLRLLLEALDGHNESAQGLVDTIVGRIDQFRGPLDLPDDLTLVCVQTAGVPVMEGAEAVGV